MTRQPTQRNASPHSGGSQSVLLPLIGVAFALLAVLYHWPWSAALLQQRDRAVFDEFHRQGRKTPARDDIVILGVDEKSISLKSAWSEDIENSPALQAMKTRFPWPRRVWGMTIERLMNAGARLVFLDFTFFAPTTPEDDQELRNVLKRYRGKVILGAQFSTKLDKKGLNKSKTDTISQISFPDSSITGMDVPEDGSWGYLNYWPSEDDIVRLARYQTMRWKVEGGVPDPDDKPMPSVALAVARKLNVTASAEVHEWESIRFAEKSSYAPASLHEIFVQDFWKSNFGDGSVFKDKNV
ncbi:MAG: CHASE2 domain-containing protein, partial [Verrucomicrobiaceae bacterium]